MSNNTFQEEVFSKGVNIDLWKKLLKYAKPYTKELILLSFFMAMLAAFDAIIPLMQRYAIDNFIVVHSTSGAAVFFAVYVLVVVLQTIIIKVMISCAGYVETGICYDIRKDGFEHLQRLSFSYYDTTPVGWMMSRLTSDIWRLGNTLSWGLVDFAWGFCMMVITSIVMLVLEWKLALLTFTVIPLLFVVSIYFQKRILLNHRDIRKTNSLITAAFNEGIQGVKTTKTLVREEGNLEDFMKLTGEMNRKSISAATFAAIYMPIVTLLGSIAAGIVLWKGGNRLMAGTLSYGTLAAFISYAIQFFFPIRDMARIFTDLQSAQASAERIMSLLETKPDIVDDEEELARKGLNDRRNWPKIKGNIVFENVSFAYKNGEKVLENFNLTVKAGEKIALVGDTGAGKSTIVNLACRFYEPTEGRILIDGYDYTKMPMMWLHSNLGYVLQTPHLFSGTIKENILYGKPDATDEEIIRASKLVNLHDIVMKMEKGYDTPVGEGGSLLSTGEKQLVSFARAIIADPAIFVLDEATSSVDTETEHLIQGAIANILKNRTSFIIAHRLSTIRSCDRILVIRDGKIIEEGTHKELLARKGHYAKLYTSQFMMQLNHNDTLFNEN
ncbi:ABC transporter ATP-binding protein [Thermoclostridium stercorarium subsp. stercorarium DSM 8532]|jgi:ATP-binding cassette subfamily B protein|uniref:ABC transporter ATP-binding protein n=3 Tax=Thermoclostridium stercorarium TaxID=1510 RepID=L7VIW7_THES1|nr:ABC transporter ATP-binding protein [Thermoclostridium stercorarium]AGC68025.1 ABC transporter ATP-binding protein [Thermoclostridium stercorarium subsp. stercorarium DSM 8532]AGI39057.1 ABC transporter ATPase/permease subunit [Thermoclostridium stercorarium subsp. stercorarium DSM 8532]ANW98422.1 ABC transporter ATP-binding protein [Thermoclostridium stercorarium subsp. thermolacticum DSM 2910]ANX00958.1 ABC transporter ATP-binding protein [Thermoclostridium stercorarium subsp. leptospartum